MTKGLEIKIHYSIKYYSLILRLKWLEFCTSHIFLLYYKILVSRLSFLFHSIDLSFNTLIIVFQIFSCSIIILCFLLKLYNSLKINIMVQINFFITDLTKSILWWCKFFITVSINKSIVFLHNVSIIYTYMWYQTLLSMVYSLIIFIKYLNYINIFTKYDKIFNNPFFYTGYYTHKLNYRILNNIFLINYTSNLINSLNFFTLIFYRLVLKFYFNQRIIFDFFCNLINFYSSYIYILYRLKNWKILKFRLFVFFYPYKFYFIVNKQYNILVFNK